MDEHDKRRVGEQIEPGGRPKAPGRLELLQRFIDSHNHDFPRDWDRLGTPEQAQAWLRHKRLVGPDIRISATDAARLCELREAIRALTIANQAGQPDPASVGILRKASRTARLRVAVDDGGRTVLETDRPGVDGTVATAAGQPARGAADRSVAAVEGLPAVRLRVLRPLQEPLGGVVRDLDLRQPDQEPRLPATPLLHHDEPVTTMPAKA